MHIANSALSAVLDANGAFLREIRLGGEEAFRGVGFVARDANWGTPALVGAPQASETQGRTQIAVRGDLTTGSGDLQWSVTWTISERVIESEALATSRGGFSTNRTGFVVLHALDASRGRSVTVTHPDGSKDVTEFPALIAANQPFRDIVAMEYVTAAGHRVALTFEGEVFEIEDQRNWTDASYKTYCRPLSRPFPYAIAPSEVVRQKVRFEVLSYADVGAGRESWPPVMGAAARLPGIGTNLTPGAPSPRVASALKSLALEFAAVEIDLADANWAADFAAQLGVIDGPLRVDIRPAPRAQTLAALPALAPMLAGRPTFGVTLWGADDALLTAAQQALPGLQLGAGSPAFFTELNREAVLPATARYLSWGSVPTVHGDSDDTIGETTEVTEDVLATVKARAPGRPLHVGPLTLGMRLNPNATTPEGRRGAPPDPRQNSEIAAAWAVATLAGYCDAYVQALVFFEPCGPKGLIDDSGVPTPAAAVLTRIASHGGSSTRGLRWPDAPRARGLLMATPAGEQLCIAYAHVGSATLPLPPGGWTLERLEGPGFVAAPAVDGALLVNGFSVVWLARS